MIKVFLAEDEFVLREGIKSIDWEKEGFDFVGDAADGELALPKIKKEKPDILITDIKMPFMDGLELSRYAKKELPDIKIIILSGYDDFAYAREAIRIGAAEYLKKPVSMGRLLEAVKEVAEVVQAERSQKTALQKYQEEQAEKERIERLKFFRKLVSGKAPLSELLKEGQENGMDLIAQRYNFLLLQLFFGEETEESAREKSNALHLLEQIKDNHKNVEIIKGDMDEYIFLLKETDEKTLEETEKELSEKLSEMADVCTGVSYFGGIGEAVNRLSELNKCFESANHAYACRYLEEHNQLMHSWEVHKKRINDRELEFASIESDKLDRKTVEDFLKTGVKSEIAPFIDMYFEKVGNNNMQSSIFRQYVTLDMCFAATAMVEQFGYEAKELTDRCGNRDIAAASFAGVEETKKFLNRLYEEAIEMRDVVSTKKYNNLLEDARAYIRENYSNEDISLNTVAQKINMSPNHFSTIFKQQTGKSFVDYLTSVRMDKARELLRSTDMKTADIALAVGYKDPHYFSSLFKKLQTCTPREYRNKE